MGDLLFHFELQGIKQQNDQRGHDCVEYVGRFTTYPVHEQVVNSGQY